MNINQLPSQSYLQQCFIYQDGALLWKPRPAEHFESAKGHAIFSKKTADTIAGHVKENGYISVTLNYEGKRLCAKLHRLIWTMFNGTIPDGHYIDHIDGDKYNNKIENLRLALPTENSRNGKKHSDSTSKVKGVSYSKRDKRWLAHITVNYKQKVIGRFATQEEATACIIANREKFHLNFSNNG